MNNKKIEKYFKITDCLSNKSNHCKYKFGCIIVKKNNIVGFGYNQNKSHPKSKTWHNSIHAEFHSIIGVDPDDLFGAVAFVSRKNKRSSQRGPAKPCKTCQKMFFDVGITKVYFSTQKGYDSYEP